MRRYGARHTQFTAICKRLSTVFALVRFVAAVAALMSIQSGLPSKCLATHGAPEILIWKVECQLEQRLEVGEVTYSYYASKSDPGALTFERRARQGGDTLPSNSNIHCPSRHPQYSYERQQDDPAELQSLRKWYHKGPWSH